MSKILHEIVNFSSRTRVQICTALALFSPLIDTPHIGYETRVPGQPDSVSIQVDIPPIKVITSSVSIRIINKVSIAILLTSVRLAAKLANTR